MIRLITGGVRSGKSSFAQKQAEKISETPIYLATARIWDDDFQKRIERHQNERGEQWKTIEEEKEISKLKLEGETVLLDCITLWLTNIFTDYHFDEKKSLLFAQKEWDKFTANKNELFVVTNEIGMGVHPATESARKFADLQGWMNQYIACSSDEVYLMVAGIPTKIK